MTKVLSANFMRLKKDKVFWISLAFMFAAGIFFPVMRYMDMKHTGTINPIDNAFLGCVLFIGIIMAVFCSLFIGTEYSDGTIRNKVIVGQNRNAIYLANFVTCAVVSLIMCIVFFVPYLCIGIPLLGFFNMATKIVMLFVLTAFLLAIAFSSIYTLISMLNHSKETTAVICILFAFLLLFVGGQLNKMLNEPEMNMGLVVTENGQEYEEIPNPHYLNEGERKTVQFIYDFIPGGQVIQCISLEAANLPLLPLYSFIIILSTTGIGLIGFKKKDLK